MIDPTTNTWKAVLAQIDKRRDALKKKLYTQPVVHSADDDAETRARLFELDQLVTALTKPPENT